MKATDFLVIIGMFLAGAAFWGIPVYFLLMLFGAKLAFWQCMIIGTILAALLAPPQI